ncbi:TetR/AcrR family transcriptional regulator [Frankia sp. Ag45/Mut15]|uniref:TetR/AcrR family transcriptional regulator n=1 Tax=Frankia umida TaxID=573489 RepID=A0ABT0JXW8_9ACTN|nr:TetR/AcrR family transcriptional regulator [Frankia umida]MCK9876390.1 TetR/AcrR family transcriptional regulator [Frankia umida]
MAAAELVDGPGEPEMREGMVRRNAAANRERILAAAQAVFGEQGATGSTEEVARRADVGIATVFRHFPTKDALIEAALVCHFERLAEQAAALATAMEPGEALRELLRTMIESGATKLTLASRLPAGEIGPEVDAAAGRLRATVADLLDRAISAGVVRSEVSVDEVYLLIRGLSQACATAPPAPETLRRATAVVLAGLTA